MEELVENKATVYLQQEPKEITLDTVRCLINTEDLAKLKLGVSHARRILTRLRAPIYEAKQQKDRTNWLEKIDKLLATPTDAGRTIVAVAGATGAGKSSLINSLLGEEEFLPTDGFRACTSVATEISYNTVTDPNKAYRAEVEFRSQDEWDFELGNLFADLKDENEDDQGNAAGKQTWKDPKSDAGKAYSKIRAVFPKMSHVDLMKSTPELLMKCKGALKVLDTTKKIACTTAKELSSLLEKYLVSAEKEVGCEPKGDETSIEIWPLIKIVRIYCHAPMLSTGLTIIDLPGIEDSNTARCSVAEDYLSEANGIFVVAPIQRAVDNKSAKDLLGKSFRTQILMDNNFSNVVFVCTKTDDINFKESQKSHDKDHRIRDIFAEEERLKMIVDQKAAKMKPMEENLQDLEAGYLAKVREVGEWKKHQKAVKKGRPVYRKRVPAKRKHEDDASDSESEEDTPLTASEVIEELTKLENEAEAKEISYRNAQKEFDTAQNELIDLQDRLALIATEGPRMCVQARNEASTKAIKWDFAMGIKEIDDGDEDEEPTIGLPSQKRGREERDYSQIAESFPVYCVSSYAYQQLGATSERRETPAHGFRDLDDTGIPGLIEYGKNLTYREQIRKHRNFLNSLMTLLSSLVVLTACCCRVTDAAKVDSHPTKLCEQDQILELDLFEIEIQNLSKLLEVARRYITQKNSRAIAIAAKAAPSVTTRWSTREKDGGHGLACGTFKAICRRHGAKTASKKARDFNEDLLQPYLGPVAKSWETVFGTRVPNILDQLVKVFGQRVREFHDKMQGRTALQKCRSGSLEFLGKHCEEHQMAFASVIEDSKRAITGGQRQASRTLAPQVQTTMKEIYDRCAVIKGK
ncbi:hypothetical protein M406DRAFT_249014 [Cryphonectria parasitica EP155]|uniref:G domain-containing protein n=1 Tax=Cryphonectria parasitica (strain ATCC 38755 / EP155) TaxID=660469 RepID=A0A9P5CTP4_CRYP1|nr:uncharacterized protein M406DRAFT_249014 [Cryphonectria parasitica EP155]KAF3769892.1 hypothetical protein M406DRAFT_249014 [Cryphonectria parasitica EP155]